MRRHRVGQWSCDRGSFCGRGSARGRGRSRARTSRRNSRARRLAPRIDPCRAMRRQRLQSVAAMVAEATSVFGRVDVLVNNVGGSAGGGPVEMSEEVFDAQVVLNLKSVFLTCKHVLPVMERQGAGAIVNVASTSGLRWTGAAQVAYAATKA